MLGYLTKAHATDTTNLRQLTYNYKDSSYQLAHAVIGRGEFAEELWDSSVFKKNPCKITIYMDTVYTPIDFKLKSASIVELFNNYLDSRVVIKLDSVFALVSSDNKYVTLELNTISQGHKRTGRGYELLWSGGIALEYDSISYILNIYNCNVSTMIFSDTYLGRKVDIQEGVIEDLKIDGVSSAGDINISPHKMLSLTTANLSKINGSINLAGFTAADSEKCLLKIHKVDLDKLIFDYTNFKLAVDTVNKGEMIALYEYLLRNQEANKYTFGYAKAKIEYNDYKLKYFPTIQDRFSKIWWNYGYNKELIFKWTAKFFLLFFAINLLLFHYLNDKIYVLEKLKARMILESWKKVKWYRFLWYRFWLSFIYSCIIFFGIKLDVDKMKFTNIFLAMYIYTFYALGLVCLVFIGNYFLFK